MTARSVYQPEGYEEKPLPFSKKTCSPFCHFLSPTSMYCGYYDVGLERAEFDGIERCRECKEDESA